jgi:tetratricopeptide (TPR) repeat protein
VDKAIVLRHTNDIDEALECYDKIKKIAYFEKMEQDDVDLYAVVMMNYGWTLHNAERTEESGVILDKVENIIENNKSIMPLKDIAQLYYIKAISLFRNDDYAESVKYCYKSIDYVKTVYGENAVEICSVLNQLAANLQKQNKHPEAVKIFKKSYDIRKKYYGTNNLFTSISYRNYAKALIRSGNCGDFDRAACILKNVLELRNEICKTDNEKGWIAQVCVDLADYCCEYEKNYSSAEKYINQAEMIYKKYESQRDIISCKKVYGKILLSENRPDEAKEKFMVALNMRQKLSSKKDTQEIMELKSWIKKCDMMSI